MLHHPVFKNEENLNLSVCMDFLYLKELSIEDKVLKLPVKNRRFTSQGSLICVIKFLSTQYYISITFSHLTKRRQDNATKFAILLDKLLTSWVVSVRLIYDA